MCEAVKTGISKGGLLAAEEFRHALNPQHDCSSCTHKGKFLCSHRNEGGNQKTVQERQYDKSQRMFTEHVACLC